jgi:hypothetical protein
MRFYPKAGQRRATPADPALRVLRVAVPKAAAVNGLLLNLLFLALFSYVFSALFTETLHVHNFKVVFVDYDGGLIGTAFCQAYIQQLHGDGFTSLIEQSVSQYSQPSTL